MYVYDGTMSMEGGTILKNSADFGGGVYLDENASFTKTGPGIIYGTGDPEQNSATCGSAVFWNNSQQSYRDSTVRLGESLNTDSLTGWSASAVYRGG